MELPKKENLLDSAGRPLTQSLFLEVGYSDFAVYTLKDDNYEYKGKLYPSLKKLYIEMADVTEYDFANTYLLGWSHWKRLCDNKVLLKHIMEWREELEVKLRCQGVKSMLASAASGNYQAAKFFVDRGWDKRAAGRPSKEEVEREKEFQARVAEDYQADIIRLIR